jgi:hypothetical protein
VNEVVLLQGAQADLQEIYEKRGDAAYQLIDSEL